MTRAELCDYLKEESASVSSVLARMRRVTETLPKRVYISDWVFDHEGQRDYPRARFALGDAPDKPRRKEARARRLHAERAAEKLRRMKMSSVFNMGLTRDQLTAQAKEKRSGQLQQY